ncbi:unnamed protein product, partial [marine sediment metagenome]
TIFAWELANEPRAPGDTTGDILQGWMEEMGGYIKGLDPHHMLTTGVEGFYCEGSGDWMHDGSEGTDFIRNHQIGDIDFATVHLWPDNWNLDYDASLHWYQEHIDDAGEILGKPLLLEEFGLYRHPSGSTTARDQLYQGLLDTAEDNDQPGWNFWGLWHDDYDVYDDGYGVYYPDDASTVGIISSAAGIMNSQSSSAPVLDPIGDKSVDEGSELSFTATATDADIPANELTFSLGVGAPAGAGIDPATGEFTWTPTEAQGPGTYPVTIRVTDDGTPNLSDDETITVTVNEVNNAPTVVDPIDDVVVDEDTSLTAIHIPSVFDDIDIPQGDSLTYTFSVSTGVSDAVDRISEANYTYMHQDLLYTHLGDDRGFGPEHDLARDNILTYFQDLGLATSLDPFLYG